MKASELRIGNLVEYLGCVATVVGVHYHRIGVLGYTSHEDNFTPIPITEEWLKKGGYERDEHGFWDDPKNGRIRYHKDHGWKILTHWVREWVGIKSPEFVHEWQNLTYALTGRELQFTEETK